MTNAEIAAQLISIGYRRRRWEVIAPGISGRSRPVRWNHLKHSKENAQQFCEECRKHFVAMLDAADALREADLEAQLVKIAARKGDGTGRAKR